MTKPDLELARYIKDTHENGTINLNHPVVIQAIHNGWVRVVIVDTIFEFDYEITELGDIVFNMLNKPEPSTDNVISSMGGFDIRYRLGDYEAWYDGIMMASHNTLHGIENWVRARPDNMTTVGSNAMDTEIARLQEQVAEEQMSIKALNDRLDEYKDDNDFWRQNVVTLKRQLGEARKENERLTELLADAQNVLAKWRAFGRQAWLKTDDKSLQRQAWDLLPKGIRDGLAKDRDGN